MARMHTAFGSPLPVARTLGVVYFCVMAWMATLRCLYAFTLMFNCPPSRTALPDMTFTRDWSPTSAPFTVMVAGDMLRVAGVTVSLEPSGVTFRD